MKDYAEFRNKTYLNISLVLFAVYTVINILHNIQHLFFIKETSAGIITFNILNVFVGLSCLIIKKKRTEAGINLLLATLSFTMIAINLYIRQFYNHNNIIVVFPVLLAIFLASKKSALIIAAFNTAAIAFLGIFHRSYDDVMCYFVLTGSILTMIAITFLLKNMIIRLEMMRRQHEDELHGATLKILGFVSELRDRETQNHLERVAIVTKKLLARLQKISKYSRYISEVYISDVVRASMLHDIGKIGISDAILLKPGKLSIDEFEEIKKHTVSGSDILDRASRNISTQNFFNIAIEITRYHHERWDGGGYPDHLKGFDIPLSARIMAVADVYDALISDRPYKKRMSHEEAIAIIKAGSGTQFDPDVVKCFHHVQKEIYREIHKLL
ncbi:MAG: HD domain-containing protein [Spirochaetales bacterium]|nr:HD domain-containing protein [Spirochaetales bacterium]